MNLFKNIRSVYGPEVVKKVRAVESLEKKVGRYQNHRVYSLRCKDEEVTPPSLKLKRPVNTRRGHEIIKKAERSLLQERIGNITRKLDNITEEKERKTSEIFSQVSDNIKETLEQVFQHAHDTEYTQSKARQKQKLSRLIQKKDNTEIDVDLGGTQLKKWVINLSKRDLSKAETTVLAKGLNFAVSPDKLPMNEYIVQREKARGNLREEERDQLRAEVCSALKSTSLPKSNISKEERAAIRSVGKDNTIIILPADKGKATVIMDIWKSTRRKSRTC